MQNINQKVDKTLNSLQNISRAKANPYLFEKIKSKLENETQQHIRWKWAILSTGMFLLVLNATIVYQYYTGVQQQQEESVLASLSNALDPTKQIKY